MAESGRSRGATRQIPRSEWKDYFERFTRQHLTEDPPETVTIEGLSPALEDELMARTARLLGMAYDPRSAAFEVLLEHVEHLVFHPVEIWVIESEGRFVSTLELVCADGTRELLQVHRSGPPAGLYDASAPPQA